MLPKFVDVPQGSLGVVERVRTAKTFFSNKFSNRRIALEKNEVGIVPETLGPGKHILYPDWAYNVEIIPETAVKINQIALVSAKYGKVRDSNRKLGRKVECDSFQDAREFLVQGGEKGEQIEVLTPGVYQINTKIFNVINQSNCAVANLKPDDLRFTTISEDQIGIVKTNEGKPLEQGMIAGSLVSGHDKFQNPSAFLENGGYKGLQEEYLPSGIWNINPWFAEVKKQNLLEIASEHVGVVISFVGKELEYSDYYEDILVDNEYKGIWKKPLLPGKYPINYKVKSVEVVPTHEIEFKWSNAQKDRANYDAGLGAIHITTKDGFEFGLEITQIIRISEKDAPKMISKVGVLEGYESQIENPENGKGVIKWRSIKNLVTRVLAPMVGAHFLNTASEYEAEEFISHRSDLQRNATEDIREALKAYGVQGIGTYFNPVDIPKELLDAIKDRKKTQFEIEKNRQEIDLDEVKNFREKKKLLHKLERDFLESEKGIEIMDNIIQAKRIESTLDIEIIREKLEAEGGNYAKILLTLAENAHKNQVPNVVVGEGGNKNLASGLITNNVLWQVMSELPKYLDNPDGLKELLDSKNPNVILGVQGEATVPQLPEEKQIPEIKIHIDAEYDDFTRQDATDFTNYLEEQYAIKILRILSIEKGSVILTLELDDAPTAENLYLLIKNGYLKNLGVYNCSLVSFETVIGKMSKRSKISNFTTLEEKKVHIKKHLSNTTIKNSLEYVKDILLPSSSALNSMILLKHRLDGLNSKEIQGTLSDDFILIEESKIVSSFLNEVDRLGINDFK